MKMICFLDVVNGEMVLKSEFYFVLLNLFLKEFKDFVL